jgi:hypothetical protein
MKEGVNLIKISYRHNMYPTVQLLHANKKAGHGAACLSSQVCGKGSVN